VARVADALHSATMWKKNADRYGAHELLNPTDAAAWDAADEKKRGGR